MKKVNVLLSVYNPDKKYLIEQLKSIDRQTYPNIEVLINDDCPNHRCDVRIFRQYLKHVPYKILPYSDHNLNYHKSFEKLTSFSDGDFVAYCDQDDIWELDKVKKCVKCLQEENALLVATDRSIIDGEGNVIIPSVRSQSNKIYESWYTGDSIAKYNVFVTFAVGMSLVARGDFARKVIPFNNYTGHDNWLLSCASVEGKVAFIDKPLVKYRRHGKNVSGTLCSIYTKQDYYEKRVFSTDRAIQVFLKKYPDYEGNKEIVRFNEARKHGNIWDLWRYRYISPDIAKFEIVIKLVPSFLFPLLVKVAQKING